MDMFLNRYKELKARNVVMPKSCLNITNKKNLLITTKND